MSNDPKDWLLREALTGHHSAPLTPEHGPDHEQSAVYMKHCSTTTALATTTNTDGGVKGNESGSNLRQAQVHSWLHHIKNQVENEPNVFEDFEIVKVRRFLVSYFDQITFLYTFQDREIKNSVQFDSIKAELSDDVEALFRPYFEAVR